MRTLDQVQFSWRSLRSAPLRSLLTSLGILIGIATVVLLTGIGEGVRQYVLAEFTQFGTRLVAIVPGKTSTFGISGATVNNIRPLSLDDALALSRLNGVEGFVPVVQGNAAVEGHKRQRRSMVLGVGPQADRVWQFEVGIGRFLPPGDLHSARNYAVLGDKLRRELFADGNPLGARIRIGGERYRVIGVMQHKGQMLGFDLDDAVYIPAQLALNMFNRESLMEVDLLYRPGIDSKHLVRAVRKLLLDRHGHEDFTIITQDQMLAILGSVLSALTLAVATLGGISLLVGGVGVLTIMTIAVAERTREIALLRALGAERSQILGLYLGEALILSLLGGLAGLLLGSGIIFACETLLPQLPVRLAWPYLLLSLGVAGLTGILAGLLPARRAARLSPLEGLRTE